MALTQKVGEGTRAGSTAVAVLALLAALLVLPPALAPRAEAYVYWASGSIGRADLDGTNIDQGFITETNGSSGVAVGGRHIYWAINYRKIGRANLEGANADTGFLTGVDGADGVAVDDRYIYWTHSGVIGRAKLDGSGVDEEFIVSNDPFGMHGPAMDVAVDAHHVYWTQGFTIGRANLDGTSIDQNFISDAFGRGVAVDSGHIYWTTQYTIGRAELDGTDIEPSFISGAYGAYTTDVAIDAGHVYWGQSSSTSQGDVYDARIGRADIDGTNVNQIFVSLGEDRPDSLAVDGLTGSRVEGKASATKTQRQIGKKIVVKVTVKAEEKLTAEATGKIKANPTYKLKPQKVRFAAGESKPLHLKPRRAAAKEIAAALKRGKKATAKLEIKLCDVAGNSKTEKLGVKLKR